ncbi:hypothetical protein FA95DRAFT_1496832 [Auriscalpium vulgare]|uniref:Uncharacterized protein n=1 Tax=Auriscalpium vulgare TaxID=40419 RepID=A0ACB8RKV2_9AGAM|nr:hypothetical protein FA95DRAFT_1496832 [Auriscalpium vulgare]
MVSLWENGISGILADEMGLGKTIQTIAFVAHLRVNAEAPNLIVCPLSVLHNWVDEFQRFAPDIPVCMYHGTPAERAELRATVMRKEETKEKTTKQQPERRSNRMRKRHRADTSEEEEEDAEVTEDDTNKMNSTKQVSNFPVVITTYEMVMKDRVHLAQHDWGYVVVDEGHRLKNTNSILMREIQKYPSAGRMILTGTPLHNNLSELWSLLNFILPDIFDDVDSFKDWFDLPSLSADIGASDGTAVLQTLHDILKPFLLRRLKSDVERTLPPKKEYVLYAPLSERQRELYDAIVKGGLRGLLVGAKPDSTELEKQRAEEERVAAKEEAAKDGGKRKFRKRTSGRKYDVDGDDDEYFARLENDEVHGRRDAISDKTAEQLGAEHAFKAKVKKINNLHLQNAVMQLRKVCSHPFLFDWPVDQDTNQYVVNEELASASGKMMVLERLLDELFKRGHKVLVFSQFKTMLDVIEDWATEFKGWPLCRIDGSTSAMDRREQMLRFQTGGDAPDAPRLFLLSTRAGGLGITLTAADTVVFYDQDWNPQMDLQAQDRAHRIGQTKPVLVFRLVSKHTIESKIMQRATEKRKLEALVIAKGKFKMPAGGSKAGKQETMAEMAASLLALEGEKIEVVPNTEAGKKSVISDSDLDVLLDRSPEVFEDRGVGWTSQTAQAEAAGAPRKKGKKVRGAGGDGDGGAFEVYEAPADEGNDALARMLGEDVDVPPEELDQ